MAGLLGDSWDDPRSLAVMQAAAGLLGPGSNAQRFSGAAATYAQQMQAERARKLIEDERRQMMEARAQEMEARRRQQMEAEAEVKKRAAFEQALRGAVRSPNQQALQQYGGPTQAAAAAAPGLKPQVDQSALLDVMMQFDPQTALKMMAPKERKLQTVAPGASVIDESDPTKALFTAPDRKKEQNPNQPFMFIDGKIVPNPAFQQYELAKARAGKSDISVSYGAPVAGLKDGQPVFFQPDKGGGAPAIVPGVQPPGVVESLNAAAEGKRKSAATAELAYTTIDKMLKHPGLDTAVGMSSVTDPRNFIPGTNAQGAKALIDQAQGQAFLQAFESLKGGGQITQIEGEKATAAMSRLKTAQTEGDFKAAANELREIARGAYKRATGKDIGSTKQVVRTGTLNGRRVVQYSDGSTEYAD